MPTKEPTPDEPTETLAPAPTVAEVPAIEDYPAYLARTGRDPGDAPEPNVGEDYPAYLARQGKGK